jgi:hypothetical protein
MGIGLTSAVDDHPAIILGVVLRDLLACELHRLGVIAIVVHCGEWCMSKLRSKRMSSPNALSVCCMVPGYICYSSTDGIFHKEYKDGRRAADRYTSNAQERQIEAANLSTVDSRSRRIQRLQKPRLPCFAPLYPEAVSPQSGLLSNQRLGNYGIPDPFERLRDIG